MSEWGDETAAWLRDNQRLEGRGVKVLELPNRDGSSVNYVTVYVAPAGVVGIDTSGGEYGPVWVGRAALLAALFDPEHPQHKDLPRP